MCDAQCDPLTQVRLTDNAVACGSPNPATPTLGCYGMPSSTSAQPSVFTCAPAGPSNMTSDVVISTPFVNGCAPGYLPLFYSATGSTSVICTALCQPADTTLESHATPGGTSPFSCADKGAGGTHECRYWWWLEDPTAATTRWSNGLGFCLDYTRYTYPQGGSTLTFPSCTTQSGIVVPPATTSAASDWGCVAE
jgi:hypothetical protein